MMRCSKIFYGNKETQILLQPTLKFDRMFLEKCAISAIKSSVFVITRLSSFHGSAAGRLNSDTIAEKGCGLNESGLQIIAIMSGANSL